MDVNNLDKPSKKPYVRQTSTYSVNNYIQETKSFL